MKRRLQILRRARRAVVGCGLFSALLLPVSINLHAQTTSNDRFQQIQEIMPPGRADSSQISPEDRMAAARRSRAALVQQHKSMVSDSEKLLKLTGELDAEIAASHSDALTAGQLTKLAEIEKLARNIKKKMASWTSIEEVNRPVLVQPDFPKLP